MSAVSKGKGTMDANLRIHSLMDETLAPSMLGVVTGLVWFRLATSALYIPISNHIPNEAKRL